MYARAEPFALNCNKGRLCLNYYPLPLLAVPYSLFRACAGVQGSCMCTLEMKHLCLTRAKMALSQFCNH